MKSAFPAAGKSGERAGAPARAPPGSSCQIIFASMYLAAAPPL
jgi:hypothetical protein